MVIALPFTLAWVVPGYLCCYANAVLIFPPIFVHLSMCSYNGFSDMSWMYGICTRETFSDNEGSRVILSFVKTIVSMVGRVSFFSCLHKSL